MAQGSQAYPIAWGRKPALGPKMLAFVLDFTQGATYTFDLLIEMSTRQIDILKCFYIDNTQNSKSVVLTFGATGISVSAPPGTAGMFPVLSTPGDTKFAAVSSGNVRVPIIFFNIEMPFDVWGATGTRLLIDTAANILTTTPTTPTLAFATDINQLFVFDGTEWWIDNSYLTPETGSDQDLGYLQFSNRIGYGKTYVADKLLSYCRIGFGSASDPGQDGQIRYQPNGGPLQINVSGAWQGIPIAVFLRNIAAENYALEHEPLGNWIKAFSGDTEAVGLNGLPLVQGYHVSMGSYPFPQELNGGSF